MPAPEGTWMKSYYLDENSADPDALQARLEATNLIPIQLPLMVSIADKMNTLRSAEITSLADLRRALKDSDSITPFSKKSGIDAEYLKLLRRTVNGFFPKPRSLKEIDWLDQGVVSRVKKAGIANTRQLFDAVSSGITDLAKDVGVDIKDLREFTTISNLCRIQWVSPSFARVLAAAGTTSASGVAEADPETLYEAITKANQDARF